MLNIPEFGAHVRVWPMPGRRVQLDARPADQWGGGRFLPAKGATVVWSLFHLEAMRAGDLLLHAPPCDAHAFGEQSDSGKFQHEECLKCGRTQNTAQQYDVDFDKGVQLLKADEAAAKKASAQADARTKQTAVETAADPAAPAADLGRKGGEVVGDPAVPSVESKE